MANYKVKYFIFKTFSQIETSASLLGEQDLWFVDKKLH